MSQQTAPKDTPTVQLERSYEAAPEELWALWTTKEGFESWWGPEGFRVEVHALDAREGGELNYDMIADAPEMIAHMKAQGMPLSHGTRGRFTDVRPHRHLAIVHVIDFIPGQPPYENRMEVDFIPEGRTVRMVVRVEPHRDPHWTQMATQGMESQLTKVPAALAARKAAWR